MGTICAPLTDSNYCLYRFGMRIHALWCHPRSMSTAVERIMCERGDLDVPHEPFMYHYYIGLNHGMFPGFQPAEGHPTLYVDIRDMIRKRAKERPVFFKDMAYYVLDELTADLSFARQMSHAFLVRDPAESVVSYAKKQPDFTLEEVGVEAQWRLLEVLRSVGIRPLILRSELIRQDPGKEMARLWTHQGLPQASHALRWGQTVPEGWHHVAHWHPEVLASQGIKPPEEARDIDAELKKLGQPYTDYVAHHRRFYARFLALRDVD